MPPAAFRALAALAVLASAAPSVAARALPLRRRAPPSYPVLSCGSVLVNNETYIDGDTNDYFAIVNATQFTVVATNLGVDASSPACDPSVQMDLAPEGQGQFPVTEQDFGDGDSFNLTVGPSSPVRNLWDLWFACDELCEYDIRLTRVEIVCP